VVEILRAAGDIVANCLNGAAGHGINPDIGPGRRNFQFSNALSVARAQSLAVHTFVSEPTFGSTDPLDAGLLKLFEASHS
jgi:hypothetical protein